MTSPVVVMTTVCGDFFFLTASTVLAFDTQKQLILHPQ